jgi:D-lactate dehydrogenase (cytochrome)
MAPHAADQVHRILRLANQSAVPVTAWGAGSSLEGNPIPLADRIVIDFAQMNRTGQTDLPVAHNLFLEFRGAAEPTLATELDLAQEVCTESECRTFTPGLGRAARNKPWNARHEVAEALIRVHPGQGYPITDAAVPISQYPALVAHTAQVLRSLAGVEGYLCGHAEDGFMHAIHIFDDQPGEYERVQRRFNDRTVPKAIKLGGTCTGEHGMGQGGRGPVPGTERERGLADASLEGSA